MKLSAFACAISGFALSTLTLAIAQAAEESTAEIEKVEVTGSRLKGVDLEGANPIQTFSQQELVDRGYNTVAEFLKDLPQAATAGTFSEAGGVGGADGAPAGAAGVSLRGLGSSSTLVLVNGRRVAVDSFSNGGDSFVNVNAIPLAAIERIDVLTDGASSIYGSDALAGVINFILRKDFVGNELTAQYGNDTSGHDASRTGVTYAGGFNTENTNTTLVLDYINRNAIFNSDRPIDVTFKSYTQVDIDGVKYPEAWCGSDTTRKGTACAYDYVIQRAIQPDMENFGATVNHQWKLKNDFTFFSEGMYQLNTGHAYEAPAGYNVKVPGDAAYIPGYIRDLNAKNDLGSDGKADAISVRTRFPERRIQDYTTESYRLLAGLRGDWGDWGWESAAIYGKSTNEVKHVSGYMNYNALQDAIAAGTFNPFNLGMDNSPEAIAALRDLAIRNGDSEMFSLDANVTGELFDMPAGMVSGVFGGEYRREDISDNPALSAVNEDVIGLGASSAEAARNQFAFYGEVNLPLLEQLDLITALRYDNYSGFGGDINPKVSLRYQALESLVLRSSWSTGFRAPSLSQIGAGTALGSAYINCGAGEPFNALCGTDGATAGELEFDQQTTGNKDLDAETSEAINAGFSWNITDEWQFTLDYWRYKHDDIVDIDANTTLAACVDGSALVVGSVGQLGSEFGCVVNSDGDISFLRTGYFNVGKQKTDGLDYRMSYKLDTQSLGEYSWYVSGTQTFSFERQVAPGEPFEDLLGRLSGDNETARPESVIDAGVDWALGDWSAGLGAHYVSSMGDGDFKFDNDTVDSWLTFNANVGVVIMENHSLNLSVRNLTDEEPPYASSPTNGYAASIHDWLGQRWNLRYNLRF